MSKIPEQKFGNGGGGGDDIARIAAQLQLQDNSNNDDGDDDAASIHTELEQEPEIEPDEEPERRQQIEPEMMKTPIRTPPSPSPPEIAESIIGDNRRAPAFQLSKQHTGLKNRSFGVGMAVMPTSKMEFNQLEREDFGIVKINRPIGDVTSPGGGGPDNTDAMSTVSSAAGGLTDQGYYDLKFYHNKLW